MISAQDGIRRTGRRSRSAAQRTALRQIKRRRPTAQTPLPEPFGRVWLAGAIFSHCIKVVPQDLRDLIDAAIERRAWS